MSAGVPRPSLIRDDERPTRDPAALALRFVEDLDRCEHGRHRCDDCFVCADVPGNGQQSRGNPRARDEDPRTRASESVLGFDLYGRLYVLVDPGVDRFAAQPHIELRARKELASGANLYFDEPDEFSALPRPVQADNSLSDAQPVATPEQFVDFLVSLDTDYEKRRRVSLQGLISTAKFIQAAARDECVP